MSEVENALTAIATLIKTIPTTNPPEGRVWVHPTQARSINLENLPAVVISKMNTEPGSWVADSFGAGRHDWEILIAVYVEEGPIVVTNSDDATIAAMTNASEWYKLLADLLYENMTLSGTVDIIGNGEGKLFDYITDNIIWNAKQYYGHLFVIPVVQKVIQGVSA